MRDTPDRKLIALTGSTGFIGSHLARALPGDGYRVRVLLRQPAAVPSECSSAVIGDLRRPGNLAAALSGVNAIIHTAGLPETMTGQPNDDFRDFDAETTRALLRRRRGLASDDSCSCRRCVRRRGCPAPVC